METWGILSLLTQYDLEDSDGSWLDTWRKGVCLRTYITLLFVKDYILIVFFYENQSGIRGSRFKELGE